MDTNNLVSNLKTFKDYGIFQDTTWFSPRKKKGEQAVFKKFSPRGISTHRGFEPGGLSHLESEGGGTGK